MVGSIPPPLRSLSLALPFGLRSGSECGTGDRPLLIPPPPLDRPMSTVVKAPPLPPEAPPPPPVWRARKPGDLGGSTAPRRLIHR